MLNMSETAEPRGNHEIQYYNVQDAGRNITGHGADGAAKLVPRGAAQIYGATSVENRPHPDAAVVGTVVRKPRPVGVVPVWGTPAPKPSSMENSVARQGPATPTVEERFEQARKANQPVRGRDPIYGATISD